MDTFRQRTRLKDGQVWKVKRTQESTCAGYYAQEQLCARARTHEGTHDGTKSPDIKPIDPLSTCSIAPPPPKKKHTLPSFEHPNKRYKKVASGRSGKNTSANDKNIKLKKKNQELDDPNLTVQWVDTSLVQYCSLISEYKLICRRSLKSFDFFREHVPV